MLIHDMYQPGLLLLFPIFTNPFFATKKDRFPDLYKCPCRVPPGLGLLYVVVIIPYKGGRVGYIPPGHF